MTHNVGNSIDLGSGIHNKQFLGVLVSFEDGLDVCLILLASLPRGTNQRLTATSNGGMSDWVKPGEYLGVGKRYRLKQVTNSGVTSSLVRRPRNYFSA